MNVFEGTAEYYNTYRPGVPDELVRLAVEATDDKEPKQLLDLGTGTGQVLETFLPYFDSVVAVEPDAAMIRFARARLEPKAQDKKIIFIQATAEDALDSIEDEADLVTIAHAFHWMDQLTVLEKLDRVVSPMGVLAIFGDSAGFWTQREEEWQTEARRVIQGFLGASRRIGAKNQGQGSPYPQNFPDILRQSTFSDVEVHQVPHLRRWKIDSLIGYLYSTSYAARYHFGTDASAFEAALNDTLSKFVSSDGYLEEHNELQLLLARRPT